MMNISEHVFKFEILNQIKMLTFQHVHTASYHVHTASYLGRTYTAEHLENKPELISKSRKDKNLRCPDGCMLSFVHKHTRQSNKDTRYVKSHFRHTSTSGKSTCGFCTKYGSGGESQEHIDAKAIIAANSNVILTRQCHHPYCRRNIRIPLTGQGIMEYKIAPYFIDVMFPSVAVEIKHSSSVKGVKREMLNRNYIWYEVASKYSVHHGIYEFEVLDTSGEYFCDGTTCQHGEDMKETEHRERLEHSRHLREKKEREQVAREEAAREQEKRKKEMAERWERPHRERLTFQHIGTARHRGNENTMDVMLYGRQADGTSTAVRVVGIDAYGFLKADITRRERLAINQWVQWLTSMQRSDRGEAKYKKENDTNKPPEDVLNYWQWCFGTAAVLESDIQWSEVSGFNIRLVRDVEPPQVWKFSVKRYDIWRALLSIFKDPVGVYDRIRKFRAKMVTCNNDESLSVKGMPPQIRIRKPEIYETMFQPEIVWMVDHQLPACSWMTVPQSRDTTRKTSCTVEVECSPDGVQPCPEPPIPMAPFRVSSYDIEACPYVNPETGECEFPEAYRDCITTIGVTSFNMVDAKMKQDVFMFEPEGQPKCLRLSPLDDDVRTDEYDPSETTVHAYTNEFEMLHGFSDFIREYDPDIITGYNVLNFDNVYLLQRIEALCPHHDGDYCSNCSSIRTFSRINRPSTLRKRYTHTQQRGGQETWEAWIEGRDWMDLYRVVQTDHKLRSYKLDNVCSELLGTKKIHIAYDDIPKHQQTPEGREFLAQYCVKDAWLPCQIMIKRCKLVNAIQMSQVTGVPLTSIIHRGQQIRTLLLMLQFCKARCRKNPEHPRYFLPDESSNKPPPIDGFEGAVVITPLPGFYQTPVVTLDFASLYPSIMRAYNMCFSTLVPSFSEAKRLKLEWSPETHMIKDVNEEHYPEVRPVRSFDYPEGGKFEYVSSDDNVCFVTTKKRVGILPEILEQLLSNRKRVKKLRKQFHEKSMDYAVLDGRQLALKVCANSVYGFTGAGMGYLGEKRIASSVTRVGRGMANHTKWMCEDRYKDHGLQIVYGDTDSVFANIPPSMCDTNCSREELIAKVDKIGDEMGKFCTQAFLPPNDLEYEKFYYPLLLKGKKRYAGHKFEPGLAPKLDVKGFECVRRDFAPIVSKTQKTILVKLCKENDIQGAIDYARQIVVQLLENKVPLEDLTMSKKLTRKPEDYKNPAPHSELAKRLQATQPAHIAPKTGDRIDFVIRPGYKGEKTCMRAVTPDDVRNGVASADTRWYLSNQLEQPLRRIFEMIMDNASNIFEVSSVQQSATISNPMMRSFVQRSEGHKKRTHSGASVEYKKKKKHKQARSITSFFN